MYTYYIDSNEVPLTMDKAKILQWCEENNISLKYWVIVFKDNRNRDVYPFGYQTVEQFLNKYVSETGVENITGA